MSERKNVPEVRFAGFTDPWEQRKLGDIASFGGGHTPSMADSSNYEDGDILWVTSQDVKRSYLDETTTMITERGAGELTRYPSGSLVMVTRSGILRHTLPVAMLLKPSTVNQDIKVIQPDSSCSALWLLQFFKAHNKTLLLEYGKTGTTVESVDFVKLTKMGLQMPLLPEQQAIGAFFSRLDDLITLHQRKHDKLVVLKKSMLEKMFPKEGESVPEVRFAGFTDHWEQRKFADEFDFLRNNTLSRSELSADNGGTFDVHYGDVLVKYGSILNLDEAELPRIENDAVAEGLNCDRLRDGDVVVADTAEDVTAGKCSELCNLRERRVFSGLHTIACRPLRRYAPGFLGHYLNSPTFHDRLIPFMQGIKVIALSKMALETSLLSAPSVEEQARISTVLTRLDDLITLHQRKLALLKNIKQSMLDKMFV
ncbi:restriction endonuclease subunit S [Bifidobacterium saguinibicoloris]|uniref:restriction endonuclease subunit S n=1 Tax=Bifidobacterium saguinibicoloris TaxID=2834433 RepID=UPI001C585282|nr:restriction endonuclease subunit S [Bifidobacterium saguinibicoloris]MBW3080716.1 restriction endonuclease subunit S [Bifidobacterium saguinibicoloris]